jgi:hypothetical protein
MADDPTLPFSALNQQPGVSGLQDISLPIGDILDGIQALKNTVFSLDDLGDALDGDIGEAFADATPLDEIADAVIGRFEAPEGPSTGASIEEITDEIVAQTNILLDALDDTEQQILDALTGEIDDISVTVESIEIDPDELADEIADELDIPGDGGTIINFDSVFGAVASTIEDSFQLALDTLIGDPTNLPGDIDTVVGALAALLNQVGQQPQLPDVPKLPEIGTEIVQRLIDLPGGQLLDAPDTFIDAQIDRVTDGLVDADAQQNLEQSIREAP